MRGIGCVVGGCGLFKITKFYSTFSNKVNGMNTTKEKIIAELHKFISKRPGMDFADYGDVTTYRADYRGILKDYDHARQLLRFVEMSCSITADDIIKASERAFSGRLEWDAEKQRFCYTTGQYFPTEYRAAACAVLASAIWAWYRDQCRYETGAEIRKRARGQFGKGIQLAWFS